MIWQKGHKLQGGRYVIEKVLGEGGFGITYKVLHTALQDYVVIKTLNDDLRDEPDFDNYEEKFKQEARILKKLSKQKNKNIVRVTDLFEENKIWYLVMDFIEGESLQDLVKKRKLSETEAVNYIRQVGEALVVCHNKNLFHRDAHPGNIMIQEDGTAILIDFGLAGEIIPSSRYEGFKPFAHPIFAPYEQGFRERKPTIDVYTLAASLYYAVTRNLPAAGSERYKEVRLQRHADPLISPEQYNPDISNDVKFAIEKGMKLEPQFRPQSMAKWLALLPEVDNSKIPNDDYEVEIKEDIEEDTTSPTDSIPSRYKRTIKHEFDIVKTLGVIFNYLGEGLKVTFFITIDVLERIINILGDILAGVFEVLGNILAAVSHLPLLELGYITFYSSFLGFLSGVNAIASAITFTIAIAIASASANIYVNVCTNTYLNIFIVASGIAFISALVAATGDITASLDSSNIYAICYAYNYFYCYWATIVNVVASDDNNPDFYFSNLCLFFNVMLGLRFGWLGVAGGILLWILCVLFLLAYFSAKKKLEKQSFSTWKQSFIYTVTSSLGVFLGWLVYQNFPIFANR
jgi:serine/threonine protein kinase